MERRPDHPRCNPARHHDLRLDRRRALGRGRDPDHLAVLEAAIVRILGIDLDEHVLLQLRQPRGGALLLAAAFVLDETAARDDEREFLRVVGGLVRGITRRQAVEALAILVGRVLLDQLPIRREQRLAMDRHRIRERPHHGAGLGVAERRASMVDGDALDATREVGLPVLPLGCRLLLLGEVVPPPELLEHFVVELGIAVLDLRAHAVDTLGEEVHAIALDAEARTEGKAAVADRHARVVEDRSTRVPLLGDRLALGVDVGELGVRVPP